MFVPPAPQLLAPLPAWFAVHGRRLPWRAEDLDAPHPDPYAVLVSELMLQQTQVATVVPFFLRWMARFPDPAALARAGDDEVHKLWEGLGYYRRARFLKETACIVAERGWPDDLGSLPGLGPYTAAALAAIAFQRPTPALDGNLYRVLARLLGLLEDPRSRAQELREWLRPALSALGPSRITQALMDLGASVCSPRADCPACPLETACEARRLGIVDRIPQPVERAKVTKVELRLLAIEASGDWLLREPSRRGLLSGLWRWPAQEGDLVPCGSVPLTVRAAGLWKPWVQVYTHRRELVTPMAIRLSEAFPAPPGHAWVAEAELATLPLGKRDQRLRALLGEPTAAGVDPATVSALLRWILAPARLEEGPRGSQDHPSASVK